MLNAMSICNVTLSQNQTCLIQNINDDVWINIFYFCNVRDFLSIRRTYKLFYSITNHTKHLAINKYWKSACLRWCNNFDTLFNLNNTTDWMELFKGLFEYLTKDLRYKNMRSINLYRLLQAFGFNRTLKRSEFLSCCPVIRHSERSIVEAVLLPSKHNKHPILYACKCDNLLIFKLLSELELKDNEDNDMNIGEIVDTDRQVAGFGNMTVLSIVAKCHSYKISKFLLDMNLNKIYDEDLLHKALMEASFWWNDIMVELLLNHPSMTAKVVNQGFDIGTGFSFRQGNTPLHTAINQFGIKDSYVCEEEYYAHEQLQESKAIKIISLLLGDERIDANKRNQSGDTPLTMAIKCKHFPNKVLLMLITSPKIDVDTVCTDLKDNRFGSCIHDSPCAQYTTLQLAQKHKCDDEIIRAMNIRISERQCQDDMLEAK